MTRADQWAAFGRGAVAIIIVVLITLAATIETLRIGPAAAGLLYLLPVLWISAQAGLTSGLATAATAAFCYNFFLLEPRYTLRIHGVSDVAAFVVLMVVALVTSRLASGLRAREIETRARADASATEAAFVALLVKSHTLNALDVAALGFMADHYGEAMLVRGDSDAANTPITVLGHDLRTPLTVLKAGLSEIGGDTAGRLGREVDRIARLGEDLIAAARLESGQAVQLEPVDLVDIIASAVPVGADASGTAVHVDMAEDLPLVQADPVMLVHLIGNLVDNAVRHASVRVVIEARETGDRIEVDVSDDGAGIDPAIAGTLFDRFVTGSDREGGSGLGLAIARDLALAMSGTVAVVNAPKGGARFRLTLRAYTPTGAAA